MNRFILILMVLSLLLVSCEEEGKPSYTPKPAVSMQVLRTGFTEAEIEISSINADRTMYLCLQKEDSFDAKAEDIFGLGEEVPSKRFKLADLEENMEYHLFAAASGKGQYSVVQRDTIITPNDPSNDMTEEPKDKDKDENGLYWWERGRYPIPTFADMALCYGGHEARNPQTWTKERFEKTVLYTDKNGQDHWFFDSMLMLEIWDDMYAVTYSVANDGKNSSRKSHWEDLLDYWFADDATGFQALDDCIAEAASRIGTPPTPRYIVFSLPDPVYFENYADAVSGVNTNTVYWGSIDGVQMDFKKMDHRLKAYQWYIDQIRERFAQEDYRYVQLLGFYILSETLTMKGGWRYEYKQHEELIPLVADYCHDVNEGLYWIPYSVSDTDAGHNKALKNWKSFGFDLTILQPNYYWDDKSWAVTCDYINKYDMGMEFEFEGSHGGYTSILGDSEAAIYRKERFREYMENARKYNIYGRKPIVLYTGTNALYELAVSKKASDKELYHEFGEFIIDSPLKKY